MMKISVAGKLSVISLILCITSASQCALRATVLQRSRLPHAVVQARSCIGRRAEPVRMPTRKLWGDFYWEYQYCNPCLIAGGIIGGGAGSLAGYAIGEQLGLVVSSTNTKKLEKAKAFAGNVGLGVGGVIGSCCFGGPLGAVSYAGTVSALAVYSAVNNKD